MSGKRLYYSNLQTQSQAHVIHSHSKYTLHTQTQNHIHTQSVKSTISEMTTMTKINSNTVNSNLTIL